MALSLPAFLALALLVPLLGLALWRLRDPPDEGGPDDYDPTDY